MAYSWKKQASAAYGYSLTRLALQAYMYVEDLPRSYEGVREKQKTTDDQFMELLAAYRTGTLTEDSLCGFRNRLVRQTETAVAYTDCFLIYEHVWNRLERRFAADIKPTGISDEAMADRLMQYLLADRDAAAVNQRIQQIIGELPVRFTRQKYYGMVRDALTSYIGADKEGLDNELYLLRTAAMTELSDDQKSSEPELYELLTALQAIPLRDASADQYRDAQAKIRLAGERLEADTGYLQMMQDMVNDLYVLLLTKDEAMADAAVQEHAVRILDGLCRVYRNQETVIPEEITEELSFLEGVQEDFLDEYSRLEQVPASPAGSKLSDGEKVELLLSSSPYASLDEARTPQTVTREDAEAAADAFIAGVEPVFASCQKPVMRAIMAATLSTLPICFHSLDEMKAYIAGSFASCADPAEKETCKELLMQMMEMDGYDAMV